jgi:hypothetical protein
MEVFYHALSLMHHRPPFGGTPRPSVKGHDEKKDISMLIAKFI